VVITVSSHLDPSCTYTGHFRITRGNVRFDCNGALITGTTGVGIEISTPVDVSMEGVRVQELTNVTVEQVMQQRVISVQGSLSLREFTDILTPHYRHATFPVFEGQQLLGAIAVWSVAKVPPQKWESTRVRDLTDRRITRVSSDCDVMEALRLLLSEYRQHMLLVTSPNGKLEGIVTKTDILKALRTHKNSAVNFSYDANSTHYGLEG